MVIDTSVQFSHSAVSSSLRPHEPQHTRLPCPPPTPGVYSNSCPLSWWCHPNISSSVVPFSSCFQSFPASVSFQVSQLFTSGGQSIGVSALASVFPMNIQNWFSFLLCSSLLFFSQLFVRPPQTAILLFCILFLGDGLNSCLLYNVMNFRP